MAPIGRDATMTARFLDEAGFTSQVCDSSDSLCREFQHGCGLIFLTGEALVPRVLHDLVQCVKKQAP